MLPKISSADFVHNGLGFALRMEDAIVDRADETLRRAVRAAAALLRGELGDEALNEVDYDAIVGEMPVIAQTLARQCRTGGLDARILESLFSACPTRVLDGCDEDISVQLGWRRADARCASNP